MSKIAPCLWFNGGAEEAAGFYVSLFPDARITSVSRYGDNAPFPPGTALMVEFTLFNQRFQALNGHVDFPFSEAVSFSVECEDQSEVDFYWEHLIQDGGAPSMCGWLKDRFGLSWQIVPKPFIRMMKEGTPDQCQRTMAALMTMRKLDIAELQKAFEGTP